MCQIGLITENHQFAQWFTHELIKGLGCHVSQANIREYTGNHPVIDAANVVIVDLGANWQPTPEFLNRTKQKKPGQTIIGFD
ncbi:hypothetical protein L0128_13165, partial [candidate division KSB1 bacterium]|nr:hypothetical protein [candidate division KSB1 bacterium]